jgi:citronellol/citronellal dehydrogenase
MSVPSLEGKTLFITGASRGIGLAIGLRAARDGANVAIAAKTSEPNPKLPGTIHTAAAEIEAAGGRALPLVVDVRDEASVRGALEETAKHFGGVDIVVNNASAISLTNSQATEMKRFDLMHQINARGTFMVSKFAVPFLSKAANPHILMLSPPLDMKEKWFAGHTAYTMAKFGMSLVVLGLAGELRARGIAVNALWPRTPIATAAVKNLLGGDALMRASRTPEILADAAHIIFCREAKTFTGQFIIDDTLLAQNGVTDFDPYRVDPTQALAVDFFVPDDSLAPASLAAIGGAGKPAPVIGAARSADRG